MKQVQYAPLSVSQMALTPLAANKGYFDDVPTNRVQAFESALHGFMHSKYKSLLDKIETSKDLGGDDEKAVEAAIQDFKATNAY